VKALWHSPTLRSGAVYAASGAGLAVANLILARVLPSEEYAMVTLVMALLNVGFYIAPVGLDGIVNRQHLEAGPALLRKALTPAFATAVLFAAIGALAYKTPPALTALIFLAILAGGPMVVAAAQFQSEQRFAPSLALFQSTNLVMFVAALLTVAAGATDALIAIVVVTIGTALCALWGWRLLFRERHEKPYRTADVPWRDAFAFVGMQVSGLILIQLERLILPYLLPLTALATYGVLASVAGSPFRVLQMGVGYSLMPRLRRAVDLRERRRLVAKEIQLVLGMLLLGSVAVAVIVPLVERWFLAGKYDLTAALVIATLVSGVAKIANALTKAASTALASPRELSVANVAGWLTVVIAAAAGVLGARWGLAGVIYGVSLGWALRALVFGVIAFRHLRWPVAAEPVSAP
jgi:O-antigen/teichoic acid export membrane protein